MIVFVVLHRNAVARPDSDTRSGNLAQSRLTLFAAGADIPVLTSESVLGLNRCSEKVSECPSQDTFYNRVIVDRMQRGAASMASHS